MLNFADIYWEIRANCTNFNLLHSLKIGGTSEKTKTKFCFFARFALSLHPKMKVERFEQLATTVKNAKIHGVRCMHSLDYPRF